MRRGQPQQPIDRLSQARADRAAVQQRAVQAAQGERSTPKRRAARYSRKLKRLRNWQDQHRHQYVPAQNWYELGYHQGTTQVVTVENLYDTFLAIGNQFQPTATPAYLTSASNVAVNTYQYWYNVMGTTASANIITNQWPQEYYPTGYTAVRVETEEQREARERDTFYRDHAEAIGIAPDIFEQWWAEARKARLDTRWQREKAWRRWLGEGADPAVRVKPVAEYGEPPYGGDEEGQERGFVRRHYLVRADSNHRVRCHSLAQAEDLMRQRPDYYTSMEIVWFRFEVPYETGVPRFVRMDGRPSRAEMRHYRRVEKRQEELRRAREEAARVAAEERERIRLEAARRAEVLLLSHLNPIQREQWDRYKHFDVHLTREAGETVTYRITNTGQAGNVYRIENGRKVERFCIHPYGGDDPYPDVYLMQKLLLETDEAEFRRIANVTRVNRAA